MPEYEGRLRFLGWGHRPWALILDDGALVDLYPPLMDALLALHCKPVDMAAGLDHLRLRIDPDAGRSIAFDSLERAPLLVTDNGFGITNVGVFLETILQLFNAQRVRVTIEPGAIAIEPDLASPEPGVWYSVEGNACAITTAFAQRYCLPGTGEACCAFLTGGAGGFECRKFDGPMARHLLDRVANKTIRAGRIGSCRLLGRRANDD